MNRLDDLWTPGEISLVSSVLEHGRFHLGQYGNIVAEAMGRNPEGWVAPLLASK